MIIQLCNFQASLNFAMYFGKMSFGIVHLLWKVKELQENLNSVRIVRSVGYGLPQDH